MPPEESGSSDGDSSESDGHGNVIPAERLSRDLTRVIDELGHQPTTAEYDEEGDYSFLTVANRLGDGKWYEAIRAAGHEPATHTGSKIPEAKLRADLARVFDEVGQMPTMDEYDALGEFTAETVANRLASGTWVEARRIVSQSRDGSKPRDDAGG